MYQYSESCEEPILCEDLNVKLGGDLLTKKPNNLLHELTQIERQIEDNQLKNAKLAAEMELSEQERYDKLWIDCENMEGNQSNLKTNVTDLKSQEETNLLKLRKLNRNNRKNYGKLLEAKVKLMRTQMSRKLLAKLHNYDDGILDVTINSDARNIEIQEVELSELKSGLEKTKQSVDLTSAEVSGMKLDIENKFKHVEDSNDTKQYLLKQKCSILSELDDILECVSKTQSKLLCIQSQQQQKEFVVKEQKQKLSTMQQDLSTGTNEYNGLCCEYKLNKRNVLKAEKQNNKLQENIDNKKEEVKAVIKCNQDTEKKIKSINRKLQETDQGFSVSSHNNCEC